jgi:membrane-bound ClpP family serine protease
MFEGYTLALLLLAIGVILLLAEVLLPTHGLVGLAGGGAILCAIFVTSRQNAWAALALLLGLAAATPFVLAAMVKLWPKTPVGRRLTLPPVQDAPQEAIVRVGQTGVTVSELRPMGWCEFDGRRLEAISEHGIVPPGTNVKVVALANNRPTVRIT